MDNLVTRLQYKWGLEGAAVSVRESRVCVFKVKTCGVEMTLALLQSCG